MINCSSCSREIPQDSRVCPYCAEAVEVKPAVGTVTAPPKAADRAAQPGSSSDAIDQARFTPGTMLTERYRIVGLLGKGGMGEVYRADDVKLRQSVALKFLPAALSSDSRRLERFHHEVRIARQVSHPNVCRVYDIGEAEGQHFISMEYVDGEDLASVLRRVGRPAKDKALQIARQLCAGLAAAHDKGVLHRDLKPHNVMIDGRGDVRITDFGLAGFAADFTKGHEDLHAGTPAYMAPEQLAGDSVSVKSDIYALGLVLYELFTGQRAFDRPAADDQRPSHGTPPTSMTSIAEDLDPAVERVVLRCLEAEPALRPSSALAVAAALPGGDPLAAALAAGETPSPELVAAAGEKGVLSVPIAVMLLAMTLGGMLGVCVLSKSTKTVERVPMPEPPQVLAKMARDIGSAFGYRDSPADTAMGFAYAVDYLERLQQADEPLELGEEPLEHQGHAAISFWYRQSAEPLVATRSVSWFLEEAARVSYTDPLLFAGMINVRLDTTGRLIEFKAIPEAGFEDKEGDQTEPDWDAVFSASGLNRSEMTECSTASTPPVYSDVHHVWCARSDSLLQLEVASLRNRIVWAKVSVPDDPGWIGEVTGTMRRGTAGTMNATLFLVTILGSLILAVRNLRIGRSDPKTALRLALFITGALLTGWLFAADHAADLAVEVFDLGQAAVGKALFWAGVIWLEYIALEPYVRRLGPNRLISWTRLFSGAWRDPLVGRDVLIGLGVTSVGLVVLGSLNLLVRDAFGLPWLSGNAPGNPGLLDPLLGLRQVVAAVCQGVAFSILLAFVYLVLPLLFRLALRSFWLGAATFVLAWSTNLYLGFGDGTAWAAVFAGLCVTGFVTVVHRVGLLAGVTSFFCWYSLDLLPLTADWSKWYAGPSFFCLALLTTLAVAAFLICLAGRPILKDELLNP